MNGSTALLIIDMQLCAFDGKITPPIDQGADVLARVAQLIAAARATHIPVVFIQHCGFEGLHFAKSSHGWEIHPSLRPTPSEHVVQKRQSDAFEDTDLQSVLAAKGVDTIIACGIQSEFCVTNTCSAALELGLTVIVAKDAHGTVSTDDDSASVIVDR
jgi:nicotinamidase-related amidase